MDNSYAALKQANDHDDDDHDGHDAAPSYQPRLYETCSYLIGLDGQLRFQNEDESGKSAKVAESEPDDNPATRIQCMRVAVPRDGRLELPGDVEVMEMGNPAFARYANQRLQLSGQVACTDYYREFTLQTPLDEGPFLFFHALREPRAGITMTWFYSDDSANSRGTKGSSNLVVDDDDDHHHHHNGKDDTTINEPNPSFHPSALFSELKWLYRWRWNSLPLLIPAICFIHTHESIIISRLEHLHATIYSIEDRLSRPPSPQESPYIPLDELSRQLHLFSIAHHNLLRREHFQELVLKTVRNNLALISGPSKPRLDLEIEELHLNPWLVAVESRRFDLELVSKRVGTARQMIFQLAVQRDQATSLAMAQTQLQIAESSHHIATMTMRDSAAMRTIAVLTMIFLPGTAIASFLSMGMFNWSSTTGGGVVSSYLWVYFATAVPLTALVIVIWWLWHKRGRRTWS